MGTLLARKRATTSATGLTLPAATSLIAKDEDPQQSQGFLGFLKRGHVLQHGFGFTILGDDPWLSLLREARQNLGGVGLEVADRLDLR